MDIPGFLQIRKTISYLKRNGVRAAFCAVRERLEEQRKEPYCYEEVSEEELAGQSRDLPKNPPLISILVPAYKTPATCMEQLLKSVTRQSYPFWELIIADASPDESVEKCVRQYLSTESDSAGKIFYHRLEKNEGISGNTNSALAFARGDYAALLDHDDILTPDALFCMAEEITRSTQKNGCAPLMLYSDEDKCSDDATVFFEPNFKPDFNLDLLLSNNYICHLLVMNRQLMCGLGFRSEYDGAQDYDLILRAVRHILPKEEYICHIPRVLYHWRAGSSSTSVNPSSKNYAYAVGKKALEDMVAGMSWHARARDLAHVGFYVLEYEPDILSQRPDIGAVGGSFGRIRGAYDEEGRLLYADLKKGYSGYMHRAVLSQDVAAVDLRLIRVREECRPLFESVVGVPYTAKEDQSFDVSSLPDGSDIAALSLKFGEALRDAGYRVCWYPEWRKDER